MNKLLVGFTLGELPPQTQANLRIHLDECPQCQCELKRLESLLVCTARIRELSADPEACESAERAVLEAVEHQHLRQQDSRASTCLELMRRVSTNNGKMKLAVAAVIAIAVVCRINFWPGGSGAGKWWLAPPAAWGQQIMAELENIEALVYRRQGVFVSRYGSTHVSGTWHRYYEAKDRSRVERHYEHTDEDTYGPSNPDSVLQHVTYKVPDGQNLKQYDVSYEHQCYTIRTNEGGAYEIDPIDRLRFYVGLLDRADRILDTKTFDGRECVGFEISADKYGKNPKDWINRIWFDVQTKLPIRIEMHGIPITGEPLETSTSIQDQFEYYAQVPGEMFEPDIPDGFINADPDEIRAAKTAQQKGPMLYADVPVGLKEKIATALQGVNTAIYRERVGLVEDGNWRLNQGEKIYISEHSWRIDSYSGEQVQTTRWYITNKDDWGKTSFDFNDRHFRLTKTTVDFSNRSYRERTYGNTSHPENPMDWIIFLAEQIDEADRFFERRHLEGIECFGFELSAKKYGNNPDTDIHTLWFDSETMLPVMVEDERLRDDEPVKISKDQFEWNPKLPADTFVPMIPEGFTNCQSEKTRSPGRKERQG